MSRSLGDVFQILNGNVGLGTSVPRQLLDVNNGNGIIMGNLGIGTTVPLYAIDTQGDINFTGILRQSGTPYISSQWTSNNTINSLYYNGSVGIGTTNPTSALHVIGNILTTGTLTASNLVVIGDTTILNTISSNTEQMVITNAGTGPALKVTQTGTQPVAEFYDYESGLAMTIANNGNIGIGSATPFNALDVSGNVYVSGSIRATTFLGTATQVSNDLVKGTYLTGANYNGSVTTTWAVDATTTATASKVVARDVDTYIFANGVGFGTSSMPNGVNIGIGKIYNRISSPLPVLTETTTIDGYPIILHAQQGTGAGASNYNAIAFATLTNPLSEQTPGAVIQFRRTGSSGYGALELCTKTTPTALSPVQPRIIIEGGNVGIGTTDTTSGKLVVAGNIVPSACNVYSLGTTNLRWKDLFLAGKTIDLDGAKITKDDITGGIQLISVDGVNPADIKGANIYATGNIGIGITNPQYAVDVIGDVNFTGILRQGGAAYVSSQWTSNNATDSLYYNGKVGIGSTLPTTRLEVLTAGGYAGDVIKVGPFTQSDIYSLKVNVYSPVASQVNYRFNTRNAITDYTDVLVFENNKVGINTSRPLQSLDVRGGDVIVSGNVGIGTTNPQYKLQVQGNSYIENPGTNTNMIIRGSTATTPTHAELQMIRGGFYRGAGMRITTTDNTEHPWWIGARYTGGAMQIGYNSTQPEYPQNAIVTVRTSGSVGIGTSEPTHKLHIYSTAITDNDYESTGILLDNATQGETAIAFRNSNVSVTGNVWFMGLNSNSTRFDIGYGAQTSQLADASVDMCIDTGGNVGIGTTNPVFTLDTNGVIYTSKLRVNQRSFGGSYDINLPFNGSIGSSGDDRGNIKFPSTGYDTQISGQNVRILTDPSGVIGTTRLIVNSLGNVGIGTTNPTHKLHIYSDSRTDNDYESAGILLDNATQGETAIAFRNSNVSVTGNVWVMGLNSNSTRFDIGYGAQTSQLADTDIDFCITSNSYVGIGTTNPQYKLDINGNTRLSYGNRLYLNASDNNPYSSLYKNGYALHLDNTANAPINIRYHNSSYVQFVNISTGKTNVVINGNGNVGIGTATPLYKLHVEGTSYFNGTITTNNSNINAGTGTITAGSLAGDMITNSTSITNSSVAASATAVKSAYDLASAALPKTGGTVTGDVVILANLTASNLTVIGDTTVLNTVSSNTEQMVITNAGTGPALKVTQSGNNSVAEFYDNESGLAMTIANNGNIGIGVANPLYKLHVEGNSYFNGPITTNNNNINVGTGIVTAATFSGTATRVQNEHVPGTYLTGTNYNGAGSITWNVNATSNSTPNALVARDGFGNIYVANVGIGTTVARQLLDVQGGNAIISGNVGVGTTAPSKKLDVNGDINYTGSLYKNGIAIDSGNNEIQVAPVRKVFYVQDTSQNTFTLTKTGFYGGHTSNVQIFVGQNLLSYYSPTINDYYLSISYDSFNTIYQINMTENVEYGRIVDITVWPTLLPNSSYQAIVSQYASTLWNSSGTSLYYNNGNVGIGTTNPTSKLYVNGTIYATDNITAFSDIRFKTNIHRIENAVDKIKQINGYTFNRADNNNKSYIGVIAQEIEKVFPEAIEKQGETLSVAYGNLIAPLIEVVKELINELEICKETIAVQQVDIENLKQLIIPKE